MIVDSHCHLNYSPLKENINIVLKNAADNNVSFMQLICTNMREFSDVYNISQLQNNLFCSVGVHPNEVDKAELVKLDELLNKTKLDKVTAIGETGLDYYYDNSDRKRQKESFLTHIEAARISKLPLVIHTRDADDDMANILETEMKKGKFTAVLHCFTSSKQLAHKALELGLYISLSGIVTFKNAKDLQDIAEELPLESILVETDSPYLAPVPMRGKKNEPAFVKHVVNFLAELRNMSPSEIAQITSDNYFKLFNKAVRNV